MNDLGNTPEEQPEVIGKVIISVLSNGEVSVTGPVNNPLVMMDILGNALKTIAVHNVRKEEIS